MLYQYPISICGLKAMVYMLIMLKIFILIKNNTKQKPNFSIKYRIVAVA